MNACGNAVGARLGLHSILLSDLQQPLTGLRQGGSLHFLLPLTPDQWVGGISYPPLPRIIAIRSQQVYAPDAFSLKGHQIETKNL